MRYVLNIWILKRIQESKGANNSKRYLSKQGVDNVYKVLVKTMCDRTYISFEAIVLKLIFRYYNTLTAGLQ